MRILFDINHPAHVHLLRHPIEALRERGHDCRTVARDKDVTLRLLDAFGIPYSVPAPSGRGLVGRVRELVLRERQILRLARRFRPHLIVGTSAHAARVARWTGGKSVVLNEDDARAVPLFRWVSYPLATAIVTPDCLAYEAWGAHHQTYPSYHELFYLHPSRFRPDPLVRAELGLGAGQPYAIVRLSALDAHHDVGVRGVERGLIERIRNALDGRIRLFLSHENRLDADLDALRLPIPPERMHHALAFAEFTLGDSQTLTAEAAVLGVPAFRVSDFVGRLSYLQDLEGYGLAFGFRPGEEARLLAKLEEVLALCDRHQEFQRRRARLLADKIDPLPWLVGLLERL